LLLCFLAMGSAPYALGGPDPASPDTIPQVTLVVSGTIVHKEEIWDRRSNPLMGRPDFLKEIRLEVASLKVRIGHLPKGAASITVSIQGQKSLLSHQSLGVGVSGEFHLAGEAMPYELVSVSSVVRPKVTPKAVTQPTIRVTPGPKLEFPENVSGRDLKASEPLRKKVIRVISNRYHMTDARVVFLTSFSGPMPPDGGYLYWGATGKVKGKWHIWQAGYKGLRPGSELIDPKRHQK
jgi:hypothetical protein